MISSLAELLKMLNAPLVPRPTVNELASVWPARKLRFETFGGEATLLGNKVTLPPLGELVAVTLPTMACALAGTPVQPPVATSARTPPAASRPAPISQPVTPG